jgi:hypothetical protein
LAQKDREQIERDFVRKRATLREQRRSRQADVARNLDNAQRRGMSNLSANQRVVVIDFRTPLDAARFDLLDDEAAFYELWVRASENQRVARTEATRS